MTPQLDDILKQLQQAGKQSNRDAMSRFGIDISSAYGVKVADIRKIARPYHKDHQLAVQLWDTEVHEARIMASIVADPYQITSQEMDEWIRDFKSWDICDQCCLNLFVHTPFVFEKIKVWSDHKPAFEKRAAYALLAVAAVHRKEEPNTTFINFLPLITKAADDDRNFVKKAVNWSLRQIGKRNFVLNQYAMQVATSLAKNDKSRSSRWIGTNAIRELKHKFSH